MELAKLKSQSGEKALEAVPDLHWSHHLASAALVAGAVLLVTGRRKQALGVAAAGAAMTLFERPESAQELWTALPGHIRNGQDFLVRAEAFLEKLGEQALKLREIIARQG